MRLEHWTYRQNVRKNKPLLWDLGRLLTKEIQKRSNVREPEYLDFRFLLPLAQWLVEQAGYTMTPEGNNPGNVMGSGDLGTFHRKDNHEIVKGVRTKVPANFAKYSTMEMGTTATLDHLRSKWPVSHMAILNGGSVGTYVMGLYPGRGKDYATALQSTYLSGMRFRLRNMIEDYIAAVKDDLKECEDRLKALQLLPVKPGFDASLQPELDLRTAGNRALKAKLEGMLAELGEIANRLQKHQDLQPAVASAPMKGLAQSVTRIA